MEEARVRHKYRLPKYVSFMLVPVVLLAASFLFHAEARAQSRTLDLSVGGQRLLKLGHPVDRIAIADPATIDVKVISARELRVLGQKEGTTDLTIWFAKGGASLSYHVVVGADLTGLRAEFRNDPALSGVKAVETGKGVVLKGEVYSLEDHARARDLARLLHHIDGAARMELLDQDQADALGCREIAVLGVIHGAAQPDHHHAPWVKQPLLHRAAERGAMGIERAAEIGMIEVCVAIEMDHAKRCAPRQRPQHRQRRQVIAPRRERHDSRSGHPVIKGGDPRHAVGNIGRIGANIAQIGAIHCLERPHPACGMLRADHGRGVAQLPGAMARTGSIGGARVPGHADQAHLGLGKAGMIRRETGQAHEGRHPGKAWQIEARDRVKEGISGHVGAFSRLRAVTAPPPCAAMRAMASEAGSCATAM